MTTKKQTTDDKDPLLDNKAANPYAVFETSEELELEKGSRFDFTGGYLLLARAGGRNEVYEADVTDRLRKWREDNPGKEKLSAQEDKLLLVETWAKHIVKGWGSDMYGPGKMPNRDGESMRFSQRNVVAFLMDLDEIWNRAVGFASRFENYRTARLEEQIKN